MASGVVIGFAHPATASSDWAHWRGPEQTGVSRENGLPEKFEVVWKSPVGGRSTPLVMGGRVFTINQVGSGANEQERVTCFNADTGEVVWEQRFNVFHTDIVSSRVGWTNPAGDPETGNVYAHGVQGLLYCFDRDGKILWSRSLTEEYGRITGYGGRVTSPTVDGDLVIVGMVNSSFGDFARGGNRFVAFDKRTGIPVWWSEPGGQPKGTYYSCPVVTVIGGMRLLITGGADGAVHALKVRTGEKVWSFAFGAKAINTSPVVDGTRVYITHGEENLDTNIQGRVVCLDAGKIVNGQPTLVWKVDGIKASYSSPVVHQGRLYVCDEGAAMFCLDAATGKQLWRFKYGRVAKGSPVWADGKLYIAEVNSRFHILKPEERRCKALHSQFFPSPDGNSFVELNGSPAVAGGRIYFTTRDETYCLGRKDHQASAAPIPAVPAEVQSTPDDKATHLQVIPADAAIYPGESVTFKARLFNANGQFLRETTAEWSLPAPPPPPNSTVAPPPLRGRVTPDGVLTASAEVPSQQGPLMAKAEGLTGRARVRVAPRLPIAQDFERVPVERTPGGWINCQGKFAVVEKDGSKVLKKLANSPNPLLARANAYISLPNLSSYTIEADLMGTKVRNDMPDMGIVNSRYTLYLDGNKQRLRIVSWDALPRVDKTIPFDWKPNAWYRFKLVVLPGGDKAQVRGKVWPRGDPEPAEWTLEYEDATPNREGSPALYGYATGVLADSPGAEIFYDNVRVTAQN